MSSTAPKSLLFTLEVTELLAGKLLDFGFLQPTESEHMKKLAREVDPGSAWNYAFNRFNLNHHKFNIPVFILLVAPYDKELENRMWKKFEEIQARHTSPSIQSKNLTGA